VRSDDAVRTGNKMALLLGGAIVIFAVYLSFTNNPVTGASLLVILPFLLCPIVCGAASGVMWFFNRSKKQHDSIRIDKRKSKGCC
jgi:hypothetical protein